MFTKKENETKHIMVVDGFLFNNDQLKAYKASPETYPENELFNELTGTIVGFKEVESEHGFMYVMNVSDGLEEVAIWLNESYFLDIGARVSKMEKPILKTFQDGALEVEIVFYDIADKEKTNKDGKPIRKRYAVMSVGGNKIPKATREDNLLPAWVNSGSDKKPNWDKSAQITAVKKLLKCESHKPKVGK